MKKKLSLFLAFLLMFSLVACNQQPAEEAPKETTVETTSDSGKESEVSEKVPLTQTETVKNYKYNSWLPFDDEGKLSKEGKGAEGETGIVSSQKYEASQIGVDIMKAGGNAVDAAVATAFALGVCEPNASGLGGGGFMILRDGETGEVSFIDFREVAPMNATDDMYPLDKDGNVIDNVKARGGLAVAVPGEVKGLLYILDKYGTMSREEVLKPAIELAKEGYLITPKMAGTMNDAYKLMVDYPELGKIYLQDNLPPEAGTIIKNPDLAKTLEIIAKEGADGFYKGEVAQAIVDSANKYGGILTLDDLANYDIQVLKPVEGTYRGYKILSSPPPSSGGTHLIQILNMWENFNIGEDFKPLSAEHMHLMSETFKMAYADRAKYMGDPNYVDVPLNGLTNKDYAKKLIEKIDMEKAGTYEADDPWKYEGNNTSHLSVADKDGNMVGITKTINYYFGSGVAVDGYGFILNNEMDDFSPVPGEANSVAAGKKPLSSMTPTVVLKENGDPFMVLGAPGGMSIFPQIAQVISYVIDFGMPLQDAISMPRMLDTLDNTLIYMDGTDEAEVEKLKSMGHEVSHYIEETFGFVQAVQYGDDGKLTGGADTYTDAKAVGY